MPLQDLLSSGSDVTLFHTDSGVDIGPPGNEDTERAEPVGDGAANVRPREDGEPVQGPRAVHSVGAKVGAQEDGCTRAGAQEACSGDGGDAGVPEQGGGMPPVVSDAGVEATPQRQGDGGGVWREGWA